MLEYCLRSATRAIRWNIRRPTEILVIESELDEAEGKLK